MEYDHLFFDLDHTLWDFEANAQETMGELLDELPLHHGSLRLDEFFPRYRVHNDRMWKQYRNGEIDKATLRITRFLRTLEEFGISDREVAKWMEKEYLARSPYKKNLFPEAIETLIYLKERYELHIITNGFEEVQHIKLKESTLGEHFDVIVTSEQAGVRKPHHNIFRYALSRTGAVKERSLMIGDNLEADILGAKQAGWDQVFFNPHKVLHQEEVTYEIQHLNELKAIL
jgi:putative hydrolase of the HAD superfamily